MKRTRVHEFVAVFVLCSAGGVFAQTTCPAFVHKTAITEYVDSGYALPVKGTVVCAVRYKGGLYTSPLGQNLPTLIPNTQSDVNANSTQISGDGKWVLYNAGGATVIGIDGQHRTKVPVSSSGSEGCCTIWWNAPSGGVEIAYRIAGDKILHAIPITWGASGPTFGTDHVVAQLSEVMEFTMGLSGNHMFARVDDSRMGPQFITIPNGGKGTATDADFWKHTDPPSWGCKCTMSHDGSLCSYNAGFDQWCACLADEFCLLRHKSFALLHFQEETVSSGAWDSVLLKKNGVSVNWAPSQYVFVDSNNLGSDFKGWCYTNDSSYIVGDAMGHRIGIDSGTIWLVNWPTNTWTRILRLDAAHLLAFPAVWIDKSSGTISPLRDSRLEFRGAPLGNGCMVDLRGHIAPGDIAAPKFLPGVYFTVAPNGAVKRIVVGR